MKFITSICASIILLMSCSQKKNVEIKFLVKLDQPEKITLVTPQDYHEISLDEFDMAKISVDIEEACFATVLCETGGMEIFLTPNKDIDIEISSLEGKLDFAIKCDDGGINDYMLEDRKQELPVQYADFLQKEPVFIANLAKMIKKELILADSIQLPDSFKKINKERIKYNKLSPIGMYPQYYSFLTHDEEYLPSQAYFDFVNQYSIEKKSLYGLSSYVSFMDNVAVCSANRHITDWNSYEYTTNALTYIIENIKDVNLREVLMSKRVEEYLRSKGTRDADEVLKIADKYIKTAVYKNNIDTLVSHWKKLDKGKKSCTFSLRDIKGDTLTLDSFKGKKLLMCVSTTWCPNCQNEIKIINDFVDKYEDIQFINVSLDLDFDGWSKIIKDSKFKGLQLNLIEGEQFLDTYLIATIPRFILLDENSYILDAKFPLPSKVSFDESIKKLL